MTSPAVDKKSCFVIMPFGDKKDAEGKSIDFDDIYVNLIKEAVESLEDLQIECIRCDEIAEAGWVHDKMFHHVYESDVAVVDITSLNANVFYELGIRHALADSVTVLLRRKGTEVPFNIQDLNVIEYNPEILASIKDAKKKIADYIRNGLNQGKSDSPVHKILDLGIRALPKELTTTKEYRYRINRAPGKQVGLITGDIRRIKGIDVWVNSENTNMQMARYFDRSVSGVVRYCGARKVGGRVVEDLIARELTSLVGENANVSPGEVIPTGSGELERTHGVKRIFHAASVFGQVGPGYTPIADVAVCVRNALELADSADFDDIGLKSMLFPLLGTGTGRGNVEGKARELIGAAISHLAHDPSCRIDYVYFVVRTERDLDICHRVLRESPEVAPV